MNNKFKLMILAITLLFGVMLPISHISADTTIVGIEVINNDLINYTNDTYLSPIDNPEFDTLYTDNLSTNGTYWITSTNRPKITIDTTNTELKYRYKGLYVKIYDNDIADLAEYYFSFDSILYDARYVNNEEINISLDYGNIGEITIYINRYTLIYPINNYNDNIYGVSILLLRQSTPADYYLGYDRGYDDGLGDGYDDGYNDGRADYGEYFPPGSPDGFEGWYGFQSGYDYGLDIGYTNGLRDGEVDEVIAKMDTWIVPAIILVLIGGGFIAFAKYRGSKNE